MDASKGDGCQPTLKMEGMAEKDEFLKRQFELGARRLFAISKTATLMRGSEQKLFTFNIIESELRRSAVSFLHSMFENLLRENLMNGSRKWTFSGASDLNKALKNAGIDPESFTGLYRPLSELAKRRHRLSHHADIVEGTLEVVWDIADEWQMVMWMLAVQSFYYRLCVEMKVGDVEELRENVLRMDEAMNQHVGYGKLMVAAGNGPPSEFVEKLTEIGVACNRIVELLSHTSECAA
jgi:hypothetical protein